MTTDFTFEKRSDQFM